MAVRLGAFLQKVVARPSNSILGNPIRTISLRKTTTVEGQCAPGNAIPSHSVELVRSCIECNNSPSNGNGGAKNSCTCSPCIDEGDPPEDPSPGEVRPSSAWIWLIFKCVTVGLVGDIDDVHGGDAPGDNKDEFLDDGFRV